MKPRHILLIILLSFVRVNALDYKVDKPEPKPAFHEWALTELDLKEAITDFIKKKGGVIPHGPITWDKYEDRYYDYIGRKNTNKLPIVFKFWILEEKDK